MSSNGRIHLWMVPIFIAIFITVFVPATPAQDIHVLMMIDNGNPKTGKRHSIDRQEIETLMQRGVVSMLEKENLSTMVSIDELLSNDGELTAVNTFGWLQGVNPDPDDVVFVYYSGHGGADKTGAKERFIRLAGENLYRKELVKAMEGLNCRLKILITETDSGGPPATKTRWSTNTRRFVGFSTHAPLTETDVFRQLFVEHKGFLNLTATSLGHYAIGDIISGGYFTLALMNVMFPDDMSALDRNPKDGFVSWEEVFELTKVSLNDIYQRESVRFPQGLKDRLKQLNQTTQTPEVLSKFPKRIR